MNRFLASEAPIRRARTLFFATTSYQILLAHLLAADSAVCPGTRVLVLKNRLDDKLRVLFDVLQKDPATPFDQVFFLDRPTRYKRRHRALSDRRRLPALRELLRETKAIDLFIFNEDPLDQYLSRKIKAKGGRVFAVEDGAIAYAAMTRQIHKSERIKEKLLFGPRHEAISIEGSSSRIDGFFAVFPAGIRSDLRHKPIHQIPGLSINAFDAVSWPGDYLKAIGVDIEDIRCDSIYALARSNNFRNTPNYAEKMSAVIVQDRSDIKQRAISYHPNEKTRDPLQAATYGMTIIDNAVPIEFIYMAARDRLQTVVGDIGTSLLSARWMLPAAQTISLMKYLDFDDKPFEDTLVDIGVKLPKHLSDLQQK